jgi:hypothetical protein
MGRMKGGASEIIKKAGDLRFLIQIADDKDIEESRDEIGKLSNVLRAKRL